MTVSPDPRPETAAGDPGAPAHHRRVRSFVRREGRLTPAQASALERLWPRFGIHLSDAPTVSAAFATPSAPLTVEIGFGNGDALAWRAQRNPDRNYLGIEVHRPGVGALLRSVEERALTNVRVCCDDAVEFLRAMPEATVSELIVEFPDPWPKKRHHKRRLIQPDFVQLAALRLVPGGALRLATDWADYAEHMLEVLRAESLLANAAGEGFAPRFEGRPPTRFETRGVRRGHDIADLDFRRV